MIKRRILDRIIDLIREEAPTMNTGSTAGKPGFSSKADAKGPTAGFDPVIKPKKKRYIWTRGIRKNWKKGSES
jgi:hypothetical protein|tara:strand:+ start:206 stop:424 length:219 start_codon:yes stop_codon:yes gene_type:complete